MSKMLSGIVSLVIIAAVLLAAYEAYLKKPGSGAAWEAVTVTTGMNPDEIARKLKEAGVISSVSVFDALAGVTGAAKNFHPGTFLIQKGSSVAAALQTLSISGKKEVSVTVPEGFTVRQIAERLAAAGVIAKAEDFYAVTGQPGAEDNALAPDLVRQYPFLAEKPARVSLEGYLYPDTYRFYAGDDPTAVAEKMLDNYRDKMKVNGKYPDFETLTLASILEKEVPALSDRAKVADIFGRRIAIDMPLQADSTVNYVTGKNSASASAADLAADSPYNTYKSSGYPPGPICNPGLDAVRAALSPAANKYLYFLTTPEGEVIYSRTLEEHNAAKAKYLGR